MERLQENMGNSETAERKAMTSLTEKGGGAFEGIKLLLCENPLPPIEEAIAAAPGRGATRQLLHGTVFGAPPPASEQPDWCA
jgi:hypothetical protein